MQRLKTLFIANLTGCAAAFIILILSVAGSTLASGLSQGYSTKDTGLKAGMAVALISGDNSNQPSVERANSDKPANIIGISTSAFDNLLVISSGGQQVYVQTSGEAKAYVTNLNGEVKSGESLAISPLNGVLMRADNDSKAIIGTAVEDFNKSAAETYQTKTYSGTKEALVAKIKINIDHKSVRSNYVPASTIKRLGRSLTGRDISELRVIGAITVFIIVLVAEAGIIYGSIGSSISAIGRNPLASTLIKGELFRMLAIVFFVLISGLAFVYAILRL